MVRFNKGNRIAIIIFLLLTGSWNQKVFGQEELTLRQCIDLAKNTSPIQKEKLYYESLKELSQKSRVAINYPQLMLNGQATYQSDVFSLPFAVPGIESPIIPQEQYKVGVDFYQNIYNGGNSKYNTEIDETQALINAQNVEITLYRINEVINKLYFSILLLQQQISLLQTTNEDLEAQLKLLEARVQQGVALPGTSKMLIKEMLSLEQMTIEVSVQRRTNMKLLSKWLEQPIPPGTQLILPEVGEISNLNPNRPEILMFDYQYQHLDAQKGMINAGRAPKIGIFGTAGVGYPNPMNWFNVTNSPYYMVGLKLSWNILDYGKADRGREIYQVRQQVVTAEKENFLKALDISISAKEAELIKYRELIEKDVEIIALQDEIVDQVSSQMRNGVVPGANYITEVNKGLQAQLNMTIHEIKLVESKINLLTESGNISEL